MASSNFMVMPGAKIMPGCETFHLGESRKPSSMGRMVAVGDRVEWDSTAGGLWYRKTGTVVEIVPAGCRPQEMRSTVVRDQESYVVRSGGLVWWPISVRFR